MCIVESQAVSLTVQDKETMLMLERISIGVVGLNIVLSELRNFNYLAVPQFLAVTFNAVSFGYRTQQPITPIGPFSQPLHRFALHISFLFPL
jgi:hypothetical protein